MYKHLMRERVGVLVPLLLEQLGVNLHFLDIKVKMETIDFPLAEVKTLAEVLGRCKFNSFLEII